MRCNVTYTKRARYCMYEGVYVSICMYDLDHVQQITLYRVYLTRTYIAHVHTSMCNVTHMYAHSSPTVIFDHTIQISELEPYIVYRMSHMTFGLRIPCTISHYTCDVLLYTCVSKIDTYRNIYIYIHIL